ncbi:hypothetical protein BU23DRAFT_555142, partial [Bimuria novae-zelandiae CBS 107.79]
MTGLMLFCIAEESISFVRKVANHDYGLGVTDAYFLAETEDHFDSPEFFRHNLDPDDAFSPDLIGASEEDCQEWLLGYQYQVNFIDHGILFIADDRSARDETLLAKVYSREPMVYDLDGGGRGRCCRRKRILGTSSASGMRRRGCCIL